MRKVRELKQSGFYGQSIKYLSRLCILLLLIIVIGCSGSDESGIIRGHEWVDLGLPSGLKWATCNVGATNPEDFGDYFAWGEITTKSTYTESNSSTYGKTIGDISGNATYDAARANWGETWRMPTSTEIDELINNCIWEWTIQNGINGYKVIGPNGNSIFFPTADSDCDCWSSTPLDGGTSNAYYFSCSWAFCGRFDSLRFHGHCVRPVSE